jgi:hypothetical protein
MYGVVLVTTSIEPFTGEEIGHFVPIFASRIDAALSGVVH